MAASVYESLEPPAWPNTATACAWLPFAERWLRRQYEAAGCMVAFVLMRKVQRAIAQAQESERSRTYRHGYEDWVPDYPCDWVSPSTPDRFRACLDIACGWWLEVWDLLCGVEMLRERVSALIYIGDWKAADALSKRVRL